MIISVRGKTGGQNDEADLEIGAHDFTAFENWVSERTAEQSGKHADTHCRRDNVRSVVGREGQGQSEGDGATKTGKPDGNLHTERNFDVTEEVADEGEREDVGGATDVDGEDGAQDHGHVPLKVVDVGRGGETGGDTHVSENESFRDLGHRREADVGTAKETEK
jgi:hypothetical protein